MGHGRVHWTGNFDEIHDFEGQIRLLGKGTGLMSEASFNAGTRSEALGDPKGGVSADLDALAAYLESLDSFPPSPHRSSNGQLTTEAVAGKAHFQSLNCASCHGGDQFTDSSFGSLHNVGTLTSDSGKRMGETLTGLDTPTLRGLWSTAPYLHDGSAPTLRDVLTTKNTTDAHGAVSTLSEGEIDELVAYLKQIDGLEAAADPVEGIGVTSFAAYIEQHGLTGNPLSGPDDDADGDGFSNRMEFLLGGSDPGDRQSRPTVAYRQESNLGEEYFQMSWLKRSGGVWKSGAYLWGDHQYTPQGSIDLSAWSEGLTVVPNPTGLPSSPTGYEWTTSRFYSPMSVQPQGFLRLQTVDPAEK